MQRIDGPTAAATLPAPEAVSGTPGYFARGDLTAGTPYTTMSVDWANAIQEELANVIEGAGETLDKSNNGQLAAALATLFGGSGSLLGNGHMTLPGGLIVQWGTSSIGSGANVVSGSLSFPIAFPNGCFVVVGNASNAANGSWHPVVMTFSGLTTTGFSYVADSANVDQAIASGNSVHWIALGH